MNCFCSSVFCLHISSLLFLSLPNVLCIFLKTNTVLVFHLLKSFYYSVCGFCLCIFSFILSLGFFCGCFSNFRWSARSPLRWTWGDTFVSEYLFRGVSLAGQLPRLLYLFCRVERPSCLVRGQLPQPSPPCAVMSEWTLGHSVLTSGHSYANFEGFPRSCMQCVILNSLLLLQLVYFLRKCHILSIITKVLGNLVSLAIHWI